MPGPHLGHSSPEALPDLVQVRSLLMKVNDLSGRLIRWRLRLSEYDFEIKYKKGQNNAVADMASRIERDAPTTVS